MGRTTVRQWIRHVLSCLFFRTPVSPPRDCATARALASGTEDPVRKCLHRYEEEIERLRTENEQLRMSAKAFGDLAERLNQALQQARPAGRGRTPVPGSGQ